MTSTAYQHAPHIQTNMYIERETLFSSYSSGIRNFRAVATAEPSAENVSFQRH